MLQSALREACCGETSAKLLHSYTGLNIVRHQEIKHEVDQISWYILFELELSTLGYWIIVFRLARSVGAVAAYQFKLGSLAHDLVRVPSHVGPIREQRSVEILIRSHKYLSSARTTALKHQERT